MIQGVSLKPGGNRSLPMPAKCAPHENLKITAGSTVIRRLDDEYSYLWRNERTVVASTRLSMALRRHGRGEGWRGSRMLLVPLWLSLTLSLSPSLRNHKVLVCVVVMPHRNREINPLRGLFPPMGSYISLYNGA